MSEIGFIRCVIRNDLLAALAKDGVILPTPNGHTATWVDSIAREVAALRAPRPTPPIED